jgi:undecaprenyl-diphosphatase
MTLPRSLSETLELLRAHRARLALVFLGVLAPLLVFGKLAEDVWAHEGFVWDKPVLLAIHTLSSPARDALTVFITNLGGPFEMASLSALVALGLLIARRYRPAAFFLLAIGGAAALNVLTKLAFQRHRPDLWVSPTPEFDYGFPSGHAMGTMALAIGLALVAWPTRWRLPALVLGVSFSLAVGVSRLYLGVHYPSDVLAGWSAAMAWVIGVHAIISRRPVRARSTDLVS